MEEEITPAQAGLIKDLLAQFTLFTLYWVNGLNTKDQASKAISAIKALIDLQKMVHSRIVDCGRTIEELTLLGKGEIPSMKAINEAKKEIVAYLPDPNYQPKLFGPATDTQLAKIVELVGRKANKLNEQQMANLRQKLADKPTKEWADRAIRKLISIS